MRLTKERLRELLDYNPATGEFFCKTNRQGPRRPGDRAGCTNNKYWEIIIDRKKYRAHKLAWFYVYGFWPKKLDHKNRNPLDNRISNLREASNGQNMANRGMQKNNRSGFKGVFWYRQRWQAMISHNRKAIYLGRFPTPELAHAAYCAKAKEIYGEFAYGGT